MQDLLVQAVFFGWVPIALLLFSRFGIAAATVFTILGANLFLPVGYALDLPGIFPIGRSRLGTLAALLGCAIFHRARLGAAIRGVTPILPAVALILAAPFTAYLNRDPVVVGGRVLQPMSSFDAIALAVAQMLDFYLPFLVGLAATQRMRDVASVLRSIAVLGVIYSFPALFEVRMSPHLHEWIFGYRPFVFSQVLRFGGFRPVVFSEHGLALASFILTACAAAIGADAARSQIFRLRARLWALHLAVVLVLCKSMGAILGGALFLPILRWMRPRLALHAAAAVAVVLLLYPSLRAADAIPTAALLDAAGSVSAERAASLNVRFVNEELLLEKASHRRWFGWGTWNRNRVFDEDTGEKASITDGYWIIVIGSFGVVGFLAIFGLLLTPVFWAWRRRSTVTRVEGIGLAGLAIILVANALDLISNGFINSSIVFYAGALAGAARASRESAVVAAAEPAPLAAAPRAPRFRDLTGPRVGAR